MNIHSKIALAIIPIIILSVVVLGYWAVKMVMGSTEKSSYEHMNTILDSYYNDKVRAFHDILVKNGLNNELSFVKSYQHRSMEAARGMELPETGFILVLDQHGKFVFRGKHMETRAIESMLEEKARDIVNGSGDHSTGHIRELDSGYLYSARYFKPWGWVLFYISSDVAMRSARKSILHAAALIAVLCIAASLLFTNLVLYKFFVKPVKKIQKATSIIARGRILTEIPIHSGDELGKLSRDVESMAKANQEHRDSKMTCQDQLEKTVKEKTEHLEAEIVERKKMEKYLKFAKEAVETALKFAREATEEAGAAKSAPLVDMSREPRTPLDAAPGFSQLLSRGENLDTEQHKIPNTIQRGGEHLLTIIDQALDLAMIEAGRATLDEVIFDLHLMLAETEDKFRPRAEKKGLELLFERAPDAPRYIRADVVKLRQVLINLLGAAVMFTKEGRVSVHVKAVPAGARALEGRRQKIARSQKEHLQGIARSQKRRPRGIALVFSISDTGPGIAPDERANLFKAFVRTETGRSSREGAGLGLAISKKYVELMGGGIRVVNEPGRGATFTFHIQAGVADASDVEIGTVSREVIAPAAGALEEDRHTIMASGRDDFPRKPSRESDPFDLMRKHHGKRFAYETCAEKPPARDEDSDKAILAPKRLNALPVECIDDSRRRRSEPIRHRVI